MIDLLAPGCTIPLHSPATNMTSTAWRKDPAKAMASMTLPATSWPRDIIRRTPKSSVMYPAPSSTIHDPTKAAEEKKPISSLLSPNSDWKIGASGGTIWAARVAVNREMKASPRITQRYREPNWITGEAASFSTMSSRASADFAMKGRSTPDCMAFVGRRHEARTAWRARVHCVSISSRYIQAGDPLPSDATGFGGWTSSRVLPSGSRKYRA